MRLFLLTAFWIVALAWSLFAAIYAFTIHEVKTGGHRVSYRNLSRPGQIQQFVLNFVGCFIGCLALGYVVAYRFPKIEILDCVLLLVGFYGVTCYLPMVLIQKLKVGLGS